MTRELLAVSMVCLFLAAFCGLAGGQDDNTALEKRKLFDNRVEILVPCAFTQMSEEMFRIKYPRGDGPSFAFTNERGSINVAFRHTADKVTQADLPAVKDAIIKTFQKTYPAATWYGNGVSVVNGRKVGWVEVLTPAIDSKIYNLLFFTELDGRLLVCTFNCLEKQMKAWRPQAVKIFGSLAIR